jgi:syntaxin 5
MQLSRKTGIFDTSAEELEQLTAVVKQEIQLLRRKIDEVSNMGLRRNKQAESYSDGVLAALQMQLASTTSQFHAILTARTQTLNSQRSARLEFSGALSEAKAADVLDESTRPLEAAMDGNENAPLLLLNHSTQEAEARAAQAVQIEGDIHELHGIFQQLSTLVAQHHDLTIRIDENVNDTLIHSEAAHTQLMQYWRNLSSSRAFLLKLFAIICFFAVIFIIFFV